MKTLEDFGIRVPEILLPKNIDISTWSVIACDQYTQDKEYWKNVEEKAVGKPSTLNLILPEVYLGSPDKAQRIEKIRKTMKDYLDGGVFENPKKSFVYIERKTAFGRTRKGLVCQIDLETYEWKPFTKANIRATEATIVERIPPRMEIRKGAPLELPHIMLLVNDKEDCLVGACGQIANKKAPLYQGDLMANGGSITGWTLESAEEIEKVTEAVNNIADKNTASDGSTFLFAVGDGNHSLATAKAVWDEYKKGLIAAGGAAGASASGAAGAMGDASATAEIAPNGPATSSETFENCPVRYALVEIVNLYDSGLTFEPIHRVIFGAESMDLITYLCDKLEGRLTKVDSAKELEEKVHKSWASFGFTYIDEKAADGTKKQVFYLLETDIKELAVSRLQPEIDNFLKSAKAAKESIAYIHGSEEIFRLGSKSETLGILLPPIAKDSFFETINGRGPLPRKSFSMGEADEKRFYLECRRLFD